MTNGLKTAIYAPPRRGLPFLVVTLSNGEASLLAAAASRTEARKLIAGSQKPGAAPQVER